MGSFGNPLPCLERKLKQGGISVVQVDLRDATCFRNRVCPAGTPALTDWTYLAGEASKVNVLARKYPTINWWISPWLEHDDKNPANITKACNVSLSACPTCRCINSPFTGATPANIPVERHGTKVRAFSVSGDGASSFDGDNMYRDGNSFVHATSGSNQTYAWWNELNLRCTGEENFTPIPRRTARPELWQFQVAHKIFTTVEDALPGVPSACRSVRSFQGNEIHKPFAEAYCNGQSGQSDPRGNKPLLILAQRGSPGQQLAVLKPNGVKVGYFKYYGPFSEAGLYRFYLGSGSGQDAWQMYQKLGQEWGYVTLGSGRCLRLNILRRQGVYR